LTEFAYDKDPKQSAQSRVKMLTMLAETRPACSLITSHFPASATSPSKVKASVTILKAWRCKCDGCFYVSVPDLISGIRLSARIPFLVNRKEGVLRNNGNL
jgi:hypothetical protein